MKSLIKFISDGTLNIFSDDKKLLSEIEYSLIENWDGSLDGEKDENSDGFLKLDGLLHIVTGK